MRAIMTSSARPSDSGEPTPARVIHRAAQPISRWVAIETITALMPGGDAPEIYHALRQADYVNVFCLHRSGAIVLVRQFRPVLDAWTLEFPGGLRDGEEPPATSAAREVAEETGLSVAELVPLVETFADVGRMTNRYYGFFALTEGEPRSVEAGVETLLVTARELRRLAGEGALAIPGNLGLLYLASIHPRVRAVYAELGACEPPW